MPLLRDLLALLGPREAQARILTSPEGYQMLAEILTQAEQQPQAYLPQAYRRVVERAQAVPESVSLRLVPGLLGGTEGAQAGRFRPPLPWQMWQQRGLEGASEYGTRRIDIDAGLTGEERANTVAHELAHFLNSLLPQPYPVDVQHQVMGQMLGTSTYSPGGSLEGYRPRGVRPEDVAIWRQWLGLPALGREERRSTPRKGPR